MSSDSRHRLIVGLDYGTTYSGMSYVRSNASSFNDIQVISDWPGHRYTTYKAPSTIAYASENNRLFWDVWGYEVPAGARCYTWTKLLLDKDTLPTAHDDPLLQDGVGDGMLRLPDGKAARDVCEDFLRGMYRYLSQVLVRRLGRKIFDVTLIECWITVPATWSDKATALTKQAAMNAGFASRDFDRVNVIKEPEAAALSVLKPLLEASSDNPLRLNEDIIVCDCGGGTVDLAAYRITALEPLLEFEELCVGIGGKCGSTYIDRNFNKWMETTFGNAYKSLAAELRGPGSAFMNNFEIQKRAFGPDIFEGHTLRIKALPMKAADSALYDSNEGLLYLPSEQMERFFKPVVDEIIRLIEEQVETGKNVGGGRFSRLILVGGFGDSEYLNSKLRQWCEANGPIDLTCPAQCQAAIVRGAALRGLEGIRPTTRRLRRHYGFCSGRPFRDDDPISKRYWDHWTEKYGCKHVMTWQFDKGQKMDERTEMKYGLQHTYFASQPYSSRVLLYTCNRDEAPKYSDDYGVENVGFIDFTFSEEDIRNAERRWSRDRNCVMWSLKFTVVMKLLEGEILCEAEIDGIVKGSARIRYN